MDYLIDSHCHIHDTDTYKFALSRYPKLDPKDYQPEQLLQRAKEANIKQVICVGTNHQDSFAARDFATQHDDVFWAYGIHPSEADSNTDELEVLNQTTGFSPIAIGEIGLDYHYQDTNPSAQIKLFEQLLQLAQNQNLPVIFHVREAFDDFFAILNNFSQIKHGVVHSFSDNQSNLDRILQKTNFYIGVNGIATFANIPLPPLERMLLETDAPFLSPHPYRNRPNEPAQIKTIAEFIAQKQHLSLSQVVTQTTKNTTTLFNLCYT